MVDIVAFRGFRPPVERVETVASLPYDVIESDEARIIAQERPYSFYHISKPEVDLDPDIDLYDERVYAKGAENLRRFVAETTFIQDPQPCFYVYKQSFEENKEKGIKAHSQVGIVAGASVAEYQQNIIKKNELTRSDKETDRTRHIDTLNANAGPVFLTYKQVPEIDRIVGEICGQKPVYDFTAEDGIHHTFWVVSDPNTIGCIKREFSNIPALYVADGHHRSAAAVRVCEMRKATNPLHTGEEAYNYFLTVIFPHNQMQILPYNRVVKALGNPANPSMTEEQFLSLLEEKFEVTQTDLQHAQPTERHHFGMFLGGKWYRLNVKPGLVNENDIIERLDVSILQKQVLSPLLGIENPRTDKKIGFVGGIKGVRALEEAVRKEGKGVAFALYPVSIDEVISISDAGEIMPPKSTWFEPKLRSGLVIKPIV